MSLIGTIGGTMFASSLQISSVTSGPFAEQLYEFDWPGQVTFVSSCNWAAPKAKTPICWNSRPRSKLCSLFLHSSPSLKPWGTKPVCPSQAALVKTGGFWRPTVPRLSTLGLPSTRVLVWLWSPLSSPENQNFLKCLFPETKGAKLEWRSIKARNQIQSGHLNWARLDWQDRRVSDSPWLNVLSEIWGSNTFPNWTVPQMPGSRAVPQGDFNPSSGGRISRQKK